MKILSVEDNPLAQLVVATTLKSLGHEVVQTDDGEEAWNILGADHGIRAVVCDWRLPRLDGLDLCRRVRKERNDYISFILLTQEHALRENLQDASAAGVDNFLSKPVDACQLELCLNTAARVVDFTSENKSSSGLLPICSYCKKIRDGKDRWHQMEHYLSCGFNLRFSHSICPVCMDKHVEPELKRLGM
ncbi:MAG TPA: response regulator [Verrucomicrobiae bacterium]